MVLPQIKKGKIKKGDAQLKFKTDRNKGWIHTWVTIIVIAILVILTLVFVFSIVVLFVPSIKGLVGAKETFLYSMYLSSFISTIFGGIVGYIISIRN